MSIFSIPSKEIIRKYKNSFEKELPEYIENMGNKSKLRDACEYALLNGGKRLRPIIVLMIAEALDNSLNVMSAAAGIEFMHTASLIADDMPSMDDEEYRRDAKTLHKEYGDDLALLSSYTLIAIGYRMLYQNKEELVKQGVVADRANLICSMALENATKCTGLEGACGGQYLDIYPREIDMEFLEEVIYKKTGTLFEVAFVLGWLYGGGDVLKIDLVKECASCFGLAFQIQDDILDYKEDLEKDKKINMAVAFGLDFARERYWKEIASSEENLKKLGIYSKSFKALIRLVNQRLN